MARPSSGSSARPSPQSSPPPEPEPFSPASPLFPSPYAAVLALSSPSSTSASSSLDHKPLLAPTPFILGKCIRTDDDAFAKDDDVSVGPAMGP
ncbi:hypothetical protein HN873_028305 [Arachis hypogaea]